MERRVVVDAVIAQLARLERDKQSECFKLAPLWIVLAINNEIFELKKFLEAG